MKYYLKNKKIISIVLILLAMLFFIVSLYIKPQISCGSSFVGKNFHPDYCDNNCEIDSDCKFVCGCDAININESCFKEGVQISCENPSDIRCVNDKCVVLNEKDVCKKEGGEWRFFNNGCVDSCEYNRNPSEIMCLQAITSGCDCGEGKCWDSNKKVCEEV